jgi:hypothetical protein
MRPARTAGRSSQWNQGLQQIQFFASDEKGASLNAPASIIAKLGTSNWPRVVRVME